MDDHLQLGLDIDRDYIITFAKRYRQIYCPITIFIIHPLVIFVLLKKTSMSVDCKVGYVCQTVISMFFDVYTSFLYQIYTLAPFPIIICTGILCRDSPQPALLFTILAFFTDAMCVPLVFLMMRIHQKMLVYSSPLKIGASTQAIVLLVLSTLLFSSVPGFHNWTIDINDKHSLLNTSEFAWIRDHSSNVLVLGKRVGDIGPFSNELILILVSVGLIFTFYILQTYHAIFIIGRSLSFTNSKTHRAQLRLVHSLTIQGVATGVFFITPLLFLFIGLQMYRESWDWPPLLLAVLRFALVMLYSTFPLFNSIIVLIRDPWCSRVLRSFYTGTSNSPLSLSMPRMVASEVETTLSVRP